MCHIVGSYVLAQHKGVYFEVLHVCGKIEGINLRCIKDGEVEVIDQTLRHFVGQVDLQVALKLKLINRYSDEGHITNLVELFWREVTTDHRGVDEVIWDSVCNVLVFQINFKDQAFLIVSVSPVKLVRRNIWAQLVLRVLKLQQGWLSFFFGVLLPQGPVDVLHAVDGRDLSGLDQTALFVNESPVVFILCDCEQVWLRRILRQHGKSGQEVTALKNESRLAILNLVTRKVVLRQYLIVVCIEDEAVDLNRDEGEGDDCD